MKLTIFSAETLPAQMGGGISSKSRISFTPKGKISFSMSACERMALKKGDTVSLAQDDEKPERWFFYKDKAGFVLEPIAKGGLTFYHPELAKTFIDAWDLDATKTQKAILMPEPTKVKTCEYWQIRPA